jgi:hypothetical protein
LSVLVIDQKNAAYELHPKSWTSVLTFGVFL